MKDLDQDFRARAERNRMRRNQEVADIYRAGLKPDALYSVQASWFPPRPVIKKSREALDFVFDTAKLNNKENSDEINSQENRKPRPSARLRVVP